MLRVSADGVRVWKRKTEGKGIVASNHLRVTVTKTGAIFIVDVLQHWGRLPGHCV